MHDSLPCTETLQNSSFTRASGMGKSERLRDAMVYWSWRQAFAREFSMASGLTSPKVFIFVGQFGIKIIILFFSQKMLIIIAPSFLLRFSLVLSCLFSTVSQALPSPPPSTATFYPMTDVDYSRIGVKGFLDINENIINVVRNYLSCNRPDIPESRIQSLTEDFSRVISQHSLFVLFQSPEFSLPDCQFKYWRFITILPRPFLILLKDLLIHSALIAGDIQKAPLFAIAAAEEVGRQDLKSWIEHFVTSQRNSEIDSLTRQFSSLSS